jgi:hypothetical protein
MARVERIAGRIATFPQPIFFAQLLGACLDVVAALTERGEPIEGRERVAAGGDRCAVVNHRRGLNLSHLHAGFAERALLKFLAPESLPLLR